jgi:hypothetical protein
MTSEIVQQNAARQLQDRQARHHSHTRVHCSQQQYIRTTSQPAIQPPGFCHHHCQRKRARERRETIGKIKTDSPSTSDYYHAHASSFLFPHHCLTSSVLLFFPLQWRWRFPIFFPLLLLPPGMETFLAWSFFFFCLMLEVEFGRKVQNQIRATKDGTEMEYLRQKMRDNFALVNLLLLTRVSSVSFCLCCCDEANRRMTDLPFAIVIVLYKEDQVGRYLPT